MLNRRQQRHRTVYKIGGEEFHAVPITRPVQEALLASVPDHSLEEGQQQQQVVLPGVGMLQLAQPTEARTANELRAEAAQALDATYEQLALLLVYRANTDRHPDTEWLGSVLPVARASNLLLEIQQRAQVEDNLPA